MNGNNVNIPARTCADGCATYIHRALIPDVFNIARLLQVHMPMKGTQVSTNKWETAPICDADAPSQPTYYGTNNINENNVAPN
nr:hypothetical protein [Tanacetum cinerariifolium]